MKFLLLLSLIAVSFFGFSQPMPVEPYTIVDEDASFPGGMKEMMSFISKNLRYPETAINFEIQGKTWLRFIVEEDGILTNITVIKGVPNCPECDKEAVRIVKLMPNWTPAKVSGKIVRSYFQLPITFRLQ